MSPARPARLLCAIVVALAIVRCVAQARLPLMHQEAYYWMYAQHPSLSYYDHPPMVAWCIALGTLIFGDSEFGVRAVGGLLMLANGGLTYAFARQWWRGRRVAAASALFVLVSPVYFMIGFVATMDPALLTFWLLALIGFSVAVRRGRAWAWYLCGVGLGGAMLSKYTGVMLVPGVGLLLLAHRPWRRYVVSPHPYLAVVLGVAMFSPVLVWNYRHDWASFRFQFLNRIARGASSHLGSFGEFLGLQAAVATPVVLVGAALLVRRAVSRRRLNAREKVALAFAVPLLASVANKSWNYPVHVDWTAPAFLSLIPAAFQAVRVRLRAARHGAPSWRADPTAQTLGVGLAISAGMMLFLLAVQPRTHAIDAFGPWDQLAARVEHYEDDLEGRTGRPPLIIVDDKYELASLLAFYRNRTDADDRPAQETVNRVALSGTSLGFAYWTDPAAWRGRDCIYVNEGTGPTKNVAGRFASTRLLWQGVAPNGVAYCIMECRGYRSL